MFETQAAEAAARRDAMERSRWALHDLYRKDTGNEPYSRHGRPSSSYAKWIEKMLVTAMTADEIKESDCKLED